MNPMRLLFSFLSLIISVGAFGQIYSPVKWTIELRHESKDNYTLVAKADIQDGWWVYSQHLGGQDGPIPTTITYDEGDHFKLSGKNKESNNAKKGWDKFFEMDVTKFMKYFTIEQKIKVHDPSKPITGYLNFMTCNDDRCLPPTDVDFELFAKSSTGDAEGKKSKSKTADIVKADEKKITSEPPAEKKKVDKEVVKKEPAPVAGSTISNVKT